MGGMRGSRIIMQFLVIMQIVSLAIAAVPLTLVYRSEGVPGVCVMLVALFLPLGLVFTGEKMKFCFRKYNQDALNDTQYRILGAILLVLFVIIYAVLKS